LKHLRRVGIAIGSVAAAFLVVGLVSGWLVGFGGGGIIATIVAIVLGALIYRDIVRHETPPLRTPGRGSSTATNLR
jgi:hypothetical protein